MKSSERLPAGKTLCHPPLASKTQQTKIRQLNKQRLTIPKEENID